MKKIILLLVLALFTMLGAAQTRRQFICDNVSYYDSTKASFDYKDLHAKVTIDLELMVIQVKYSDGTEIISKFGNYMSQEKTVFFMLGNSQKYILAAYSPLESK